ncbi:putative transposase [Pseudoxanthomonas sacheonensis]|uniref:Transposase n=2 Tax=Pseudoxanthomonas sacheonensis TaxID=443615 RepID=A0ABU1RRE6_9GAMM|nr:putative transposase [Pseudoxanthomonas sacheonensis]
MEANIELEQLRREATRFEGERRAWQLLIRAIHLPLYRRIQLLGQLQSANLVSAHRAKRMLCISNTMTPQVKYERDNTVVLRAMKEYLASNPSHGLILMYHRILKGKLCGETRAQKLYIEAGLQLYRRNSKRTERSKRRHLDTALHENATWSMDFMHFRLTNNAAARTLNVLDDFSRECLLIKGGFGTSSLLVAEQLNELVARRGVPAQIRCDNGPEFTGKALAAWASSKGIAIKHTAPFKFYQNGYIERFNLTMRSDLFRWNKFSSLEHFHQVAEDFRYEYNHIRPHQSLGWVTPAAFAAVNRLH